VPLHPFFDLTGCGFPAFFLANQAVDSIFFFKNMETFSLFGFSLDLTPKIY
jgi:hypothetical protein